MIDPFSQYPRRIKAKTEAPDLRYVRLSDYFAIHGVLPADFHARVVGELGDENIFICRAEPSLPPPPLTSAVATPVYALEPDGAPAVPTGLVFVRFAEHIPAKERCDALADAGYVIHQILSYAPHAAWVKVASGDISAALAALPALESLPDVENVEPQMLTAAARRG